MIKKADRDNIELMEERTVNIINSLKEGRMISLFVEVASVCNLRCKFCDLHADGRHKSYHKKKGLMTIDTFEKIIFELERLGFLFMNMNFYLHGESLLNKNIFKMVSMATEKDLARTYALVTNGVLLSPDVFDRLIESGVNRINVSLDTIDRDYYQEFKGADVLPGVLENIEYAVKKVPDDVQFEIKCTLEKGLTIRGHQCEAVIDYFRPMVVDSPNVHLVINEEFSWPDIEKELCEVPDKPCELPFYQVVINHDGAVTCCCVDLTNSLKIGDIGDESLSEILNSKKLLEIRKGLLSGNPSDVCRHCKSRSTVDFGGRETEIFDLLKSADK